MQKSKVKITIQNSKLAKPKKILFLGVFLVLVLGLFFTIQAQSKLPPEVSEQLAKREGLSCEPIPYGDFLSKTEGHLEKFLPLLTNLTKASRQIHLSGKKLANLGRERNSGNCGAQCGSLYGACYAGCIPICQGTVCVAECIVTFGVNCIQCMKDCITDTCKDVCGVLPDNCFVVSPNVLSACTELFKSSYVDCAADCSNTCSGECPGPDCDTCMKDCASDCQNEYTQKMQNCLTSFTSCHGNPFTPKTREALPENIPKKEYEKAVKSGEKFAESLAKIQLLERELDQLGNAAYRIEDAFGFWYREKNTAILFDCYTAKDANPSEGGPTDCPFNGNTYFYCK